RYTRSSRTNGYPATSATRHDITPNSNDSAIGGIAGAPMPLHLRLALADAGTPGAAAGIVGADGAGAATCVRTVSRAKRRRAAGSRRHPSAGRRRHVGLLEAGRRPVSRLVSRHRAERHDPTILITPFLDVHHVLGPREHGPLADRPVLAGSLAGRATRAGDRRLMGRRPQALLLPTDQQAHHPGRELRLLLRVNVAEQDQMAQQDRPVLAETAEQAIPIKLLGARPQQV